MKQYLEQSTRLLTLTMVLFLAQAGLNNSYANNGNIEAIMQKLIQIENKIDAAPDLSSAIAGIDSDLGDLAAQQYVPFSVQIFGGLCDEKDQDGSANPEILIETDGEDTFVLNSILIKRGNLHPLVDFMFISVNALVIDGTTFDTRTGNIFLDPSQTQTAVRHSADILGMPIRIGQIGSETEGGVVPNQVVADDSVKVEMFCRTDGAEDFDVSVVRVSGWKRPEDNISVTYTP